MDTNVIVAIVLSFIAQISALGIAVAVLRNDMIWLKNEVTDLKKAQTASNHDCGKRDAQSGANSVSLSTLGDIVEELRKECKENTIRLTRIETKLNGKN